MADVVVAVGVPALLVAGLFSRRWRVLSASVLAAVAAVLVVALLIGVGTT